MLPNTAMKPTAETLALEFSQGLHAYLTPEKMSEVVERNKNEADPHICHSHDFCDANVFLYDVFKKYGMDPAAKGGMKKWADLWNSAWNVAKANNFRVSD
jgi:hypothetical protein